MRAGGGKQKGAQFERDVCVSLSKWITSGDREDVFWRSAMSGGRATVAHARGKKLSTQVGDITCIHHTGSYFADAFAAECKYYADLNFTGLLTGKGKLLEFWAEISEQARRYDKHPFMVAKQNRLPIVVCLNRPGMAKLKLGHHDTIIVNYPSDLWILKADHFFNVCKPYVSSDR